MEPVMTNEFDVRVVAGPAKPDESEFEYNVDCNKCGKTSTYLVKMKRRMEEHCFTCPCGHKNSVQLTFVGFSGGTK
jgi:lysyl-tRNA synthetase class I